MSFSQHLKFTFFIFFASQKLSQDVLQRIRKAYLGTAPNAGTGTKQVWI